MLSDLRFAFRQLVKNPGFTTIAVLSLALGIGATTAVFSIINGALLRPLPYAEPKRLAFITLEKIAGGATNAVPSGAQFHEWSTQATSFSGIAAYDWAFDFLVLGDHNQSLEGLICSSALFDVLGLQPMLGRTFTAAEKSVKDHPVVVLGYHLWQTRFGGDASIIGKTVQLSRLPPLTVVGVMPAGIRFLPSRRNAQEPNYNLHAEVDYWLPRSPDPASQDGGWNVVARIKPGIEPTQAQAEMSQLAAVEASTTPALKGLTAVVTPIERVLSREIRRVVLPLFGAVCFVLLVAGANVAGLLLVRGLSRRRELAVRAALGAGWSRLVRLALTESLLLAAVGGLLGTGIAFAALRLLLTLAPHAIPRLDQVSVDLHVLAFSLVVSLLAGLGTGVLTAWQLRQRDVNQALKEGDRAGSGGPSQRRVLGALVAGEIALTLVLLIGSALMLRTIVSLARVNPGYATEKILTMVVTTLQPNKTAFHEEALARVSHLPGVSAAAFVWGLPLTGNSWMGNVTIEGQPATTAAKDAITVPYRSVSADYFLLMGITVREGRGFTARDKSGAPAVVIINETMARRYFPNVNPLGRRLNTGFGQPPEIVGIVSDLNNAGLGTAPEPEVYLSFFQSSAFSKHLVLRTKIDPLSVVAETRRTLQQIDPGVVVEEIKSMDQIRAESISAQRFAMILLAAFSIIALLLAMIGIYGVMAHSVVQRSREIGIRMAVGAQSEDVLRLILRRGFVLALVGIVFGLAGAWALSGTLRSLLFDVDSADPVTFAVVPLLLALVTLLACWLPARRATRIDPIIVLRAE
jgi:putative ABC transport system permease protein